MRPGVTGSVLMLAVLCTASSTWAQSSNNRSERLRKMHSRPALTGLTPAPPSGLGTWEFNRYAGMRTRLDNLRQVSGLTDTGFSPNIYRLPSTPVRQMEDDRMLFEVHSPLGRKMLRAGRRSILLSDESAESNPLGSPNAVGGTLLIKPMAPIESTDSVVFTSSTTYEENILANLGKKQKEYHEAGLAKFVEGNYGMARSYFELIRDLDPDSAKPYVATFIASFARRDYNRAAANLGEGLKRFKTLEDILLDKDRFFPDPQVFARMFDQANLNARTNNDQFGGSELILAYIAWLYNDNSTALNALEAAEKPLEAFNPGILPHARRFKELISQPKASSTNSSVQSVPEAAERPPSDVKEPGLAE